MRARLVSMAVFLLTTCASQAWAYRPFESVEAGVSEPRELEFEAGIARTSSTEGREWLAPQLDVNYGMGNAREIGFEAALRRASGAAQSDASYAVSDFELTVKQLLRAGSLQQQGGVSMAIECAALLPTLAEDRGPGASCALIASQVWEPLAVHINVGGEYERSHEWAGAGGIIVELLAFGDLRPAVELVHERGEHGEQRRSALAGATWRMRENLVLDFAFRRHADDGDAREWRAGFTWTSD